MRATTKNLARLNIADQNNNNNNNNNRNYHFNNSKASVTPLDGMLEEGFSIIIRVWEDWNVSDLCLPLSHSCPRLRRLLKGLIERQGSRWIGLEIPQNYAYTNLIINNRKEISLLQEFLHQIQTSNPTYRLSSLCITFETIDQELVYKDMELISTLTTYPFSLDITYLRDITDSWEGTRIHVYIPNNISKLTFTFSHQKGFLDFCAMSESNLHQITVNGVCSVVNLCLPNLLSIKRAGAFYDKALMENALPPRLKEICFTMDFNRQLNFLRTLNNLEKVVFPLECAFNFPLDDLPASVKFLQIGGSYSRPFDHLPSQLETLLVAVRGTYEHTFDLLPQHLKRLELKIGDNYRHVISNLPISLEHLRVSCFHPSIIINTLPPNLLSLTTQSFTPEAIPIKCKLPPSLKYLALTERPHIFEHLPPELVTLDMGNMYNPNCIPKFTQAKIIELVLTELPSSLHTLALPAFFNTPFNPSWQQHLVGLKRLEFGCKYNLPLLNIPASVEFLRIYAHFSTVMEFNQPLGSLPPYLRELILEGKSTFNQPITEPLPESLRVLQFVGLQPTSCFKQSKDLTHSNLSSNFNQPLELLPSRLHTLAPGPSFSHNIENLPSSIISIYLSPSYKYLHAFRARFPNGGVHIVKYDSVKRGRDQLRQESREEEPPRRKCMRIRSR